MIDFKYQCAPCNPFTKEKCFFCLKIKLKSAERILVIKAHDDAQNRDQSDDLLSVFGEFDFARAEVLAA